MPHIAHYITESPVPFGSHRHILSDGADITQFLSAPLEEKPGKIIKRMIIVMKHTVIPRHLLPHDHHRNGEILQDLLMLRLKYRS